MAPITRLLCCACAQVAACVAGMFDLKEFPQFKHHLRDFLVQVRAWCGLPFKLVVMWWS